MTSRLTNAERVAEELRILRAVQGRRMTVNEHGRWIIHLERRPDRKRREALLKNGYVEYKNASEYRLTERGLAMLEAHE